MSRSTRGGGQAAMGVIAIVCIVIAVYFVLKQTRTNDEETASGRVFYYCTSCQKEFSAPHQDPPIKCPHCSQMTGMYLRKYKCKKCGTVFRAYLLKWDLEVKLRRERRRKGETVPYGEDESELVSEPDTDYWVSSTSPEGMSILGNIACPECEASGADVEPVFPEQEAKK